MSQVNIEISRRNRKKNATRRALSHAALNLVFERGLANVTVEEIADAVDVSPRTFFNYFPSKEAAVVGYDPDRAERVAAMLLGRPADESPFLALRAAVLEQVSELVEEANDYEDGRAEFFRRLCVVKSDPHLKNAYAANMAQLESSYVEALATRLAVDPEVELLPTLIVSSVFAAIRVSCMAWAASGGDDSLVEIAARSIDALGAGFWNEANRLATNRSLNSKETKKR